MARTQRTHNAGDLLYIALYNVFFRSRIVELRMDIISQESGAVIFSQRPNISRSSKHEIQLCCTSLVTMRFLAAKLQPIEIPQLDYMRSNFISQKTKRTSLARAR